MICTKNIAFNVSFSQWGNLYESTMISYGDWPVAFKNNTIPNISITLENSPSGGIAPGSGNVTATSAGQGRVIRPNDPGDMNVNLSIIGIGLWK